MLKLYPADNKLIFFEVSHINRDNSLVMASAYNMSLGTPTGDGEKIREVWSSSISEMVPFALPSEVGDTFGEYLSNASFDYRSIDLYLDPEHTIPSGIGMTLVPYGSFEGDCRAVAFYFNGANGEIGRAHV